MWRVEGGSIYWHDLLVGREGYVTVAPGEAEPNVQCCTLMLAPMPGGDYLIPTASGYVGIERKRIDDLVSSWRSAHLAEQLGIMLGCYDHVVLNIEDMPLMTFNDLPRFEPDFDALLQDLLTFQEMGVRLVFSRSTQHTAALVGTLQERYSRTVRHGLDKPAPQDKSVYRRMLMAVPGWGTQTATAVLRAIGPPIKVFNAEAAELTAVKLVDKRKLRYLAEALGRTYGRAIAGKASRARARTRRQRH